MRRLQRINRLIMHRTRGISGPGFQRVSQTLLVKGVGNAYSPGGPLHSSPILAWIAANHVYNTAASDDVAYVASGILDVSNATANYDVPDINGVENQGARIEDASAAALGYAEVSNFTFGANKIGSIPRTYIFVVEKGDTIFGCDVVSDANQAMIKVDGSTGSAKPVSVYFTGWEDINYAVYDFRTHWLVAVEIDKDDYTPFFLYQRFYPAADLNMDDGGYDDLAIGSATLHYIWQRNTLISSIDFSGGTLVSSGSNHNIFDANGNQILDSSGNPITEN